MGVASATAIASRLRRPIRKVCDHPKEIITIFMPNSHGMKVFYCAECKVGVSARVFFSAIVRGIDSAKRKKDEARRKKKEGK